MPPAAIGRRIGAALYDLLVVAALWMLIYFSLIASGAVEGTLADNRDPRHWLLRGAIAFLYFAWCWTRGGRTLGLLSWQLAVVRHDGRPLTLPDAAARFALAAIYLLPLLLLELAQAAAPPRPLYYYSALLGPFLLGTLWSHFDRQGRALHELLLVTRVTVR